MKTPAPTMLDAAQRHTLASLKALVDETEDEVGEDEVYHTLEEVVVDAHLEQASAITAKGREAQLVFAVAYGAEAVVRAALAELVRNVREANREGQ